MVSAVRISIVLPFRDAGATLTECIHSIQRQTLSTFEVLGIDDGSTDDSTSIFQSFAQTDPRFRLLQPGPIGLVAALNLGLSQSRADLIARMDADDLMHPDRLQAQRDWLDSHPEHVLVGSRVEGFPSDALQAGYVEYLRWQNDCLTSDQIAANLYVESPLAHPSVTFHRQPIMDLGGYRSGPFPEDYDLWLRLHAAGYRMAKHPVPLLSWRDRPDRTSRVDPRYARLAFDHLRASYLSRDPRLHNGRPLVVWGAGRKTRQRVRHLLDLGIPLAAWIDIDPHKIGQRVWGCPVHPPDWLTNVPRPFVLIYVATHGARDLITARLNACGYRVGTDYLVVG